MVQDLVVPVVQQMLGQSLDARDRKNKLSTVVDDNKEFLSDPANQSAVKAEIEGGMPTEKAIRFVQMEAELAKKDKKQGSEDARSGDLRALGGKERHKRKPANRRPKNDKKALSTKDPVEMARQIADDMGIPV